MASLKQSILFTGLFLITISMPDFLRAGPVGHRKQQEKVNVAAEETSVSSASLQKLVRNRRNIAYYKQLPEFWNLYKYYMNTHNQEGVENMDRLYLAHLQNNHRAAEGSSYKHHLTHLSEIYHACAKSDDPDCILEHTSKPTTKVVMPAALRCNPYLDPYCIYTLGNTLEPARVKSPAPILAPLMPVPIRVPTAYPYASLVQPFLSAEQKAELLRICNPSDVECLQYHLRAAYGYRPAPSYSYMGCDPTKDPYCRSTLVAKTPAGLYHMSPNCNPAVDPYCIAGVAPAAQSSDEAPKAQYCNPLFDKDCNPLIAAKVDVAKSVLQPVALTCDPRYDPYCTTGGSGVLVKALKSTAPNNQPECHPFDPNCSSFTPPASLQAKAAKVVKDDIILPHPDCDPEIDYNCRLRRAQRSAGPKSAEEPHEEAEKSENPGPRIEDVLRVKK